jgi:hypothetical protein
MPQNRTLTAAVLTAATFASAAAADDGPRHDPVGWWLRSILGPPDDGYYWDGSRSRPYRYVSDDDDDGGSGSWRRRSGDDDD